MKYYGLLLIVLLLGCTAKEELVKIHTSKGDMLVYLFDDTPKHKANFLKLVKEGYYDGTTFHRVIEGFMIQGGDPNTKDSTKKHLAGQGGPDYTIPAEFRKKYYHKKGVLAAARKGDNINPKKASSGSQFYIVQGRKLSASKIRNAEKRVGTMIDDPDFKFSEQAKKDYKNIGGSPWLDMQYTVFGIVVDGLDVIDSIATVKTTYPDRPVEDIIVTMEVVEVPVDKLSEYGILPVDTVATDTSAQ